MRAFEYVLGTNIKYNKFSDLECYNCCPDDFGLLEPPDYCNGNCNYFSCWNRKVDVEGYEIKHKEKMIYLNKKKKKEQQKREADWKRWAKNYKRPNIDMMGKAILTPMGNKR